MGHVRTGMRVEGLPQLRRELRRAGVDIGELKKANLAAANTVLPHAKIHTPVRTGALQATVRASATSSGGILRAGFKRTPYAPIIHFGWPARRIAPQPWITEAVIRHEPEWVSVYTRHVNNIIDKL